MRLETDLESIPGYYPGDELQDIRDAIIHLATIVGASWAYSRFGKMPEEGPTPDMLAGIANYVGGLQDRLTRIIADDLRSALEGRGK